MPDVESSETSPLLSPTSTLSPDIISPDHPDRSIEHDTIPETATIGRNLSWTSAYILVISRVIGSGIFATPGAIVKSVGSIGLALSLWVAGAVLSACGLAVSLEYGCMLPRSGGDKVYLEFTYRHPKFLASTLIAVQAVLLGFTASNCIIFSKYLSFAFSIEPTEFQSKALALGLLTIITIIHGRFMKAGIAIQNALGWVKIFLVLFMALSGVYVILFHERGETVTSFASSDAGLWKELWKDSDWSWNNLSTSLFKVFYSYAGLNNMNNVLNEVKNPVRTLKTVCPAALITACLLYLLANVSYFLVVPIEEIKESGELVAALFFERAFGPHLGRTILPLMIATSAVGNVMVVTFALARVNQEVARQGFLPFSRTISSSKPWNSPFWGLVVHYIPSFLVIAIPPQGGAYNFILDVEGYPGQAFALAITAGIIILRYRRPDLRRPFKAWLPAVWLRGIVCVALLAAPFFPPAGWKGDVDFFYATYAIVGIGIILFGVLYWYIWTVLLPKWGGYTLEEEVEVLDDGTSITKLVHSRKTLAIVGCGQIGTAILEVLLASLSQPCPNPHHQTLPILSMKFKPTRFIACVNTQESVLRLRNQFGHLARSSFPHVQISQGGVAQAVQQADVILLACKTTDQAAEILGDPGLAERLAGKLLLSTCANLSPHQIERLIYHDASGVEAEKCFIVQASPNAAAYVRQSATVISTTIAGADTTLSPDFENLTTWIFSSIGTVTYVPDSLMSEASITSGLAPALLTVALEGIIKEAMTRGLSEPDALHLAAQAMKGSAELVLSKKDENKGLFAIDQVRDEAIETSNGSGALGLAALRQAAAKDTFAEAMRQGMEKKDPNGYLYSNW